MIHKFEAQDMSANTYECACLEDEILEYYETHAFCDVHKVWWRHRASNYRGWEKIEADDADKIVPDWMKVKAYGIL